MGRCSSAKVVALRCCSDLKDKRQADSVFDFQSDILAPVSYIAKAVTAVDGAVTSRLKRYLTLSSTSGAHRFMHLAWALRTEAPSSPSVAPAVWTAARLVEQTT
jgi:hypothetical protein